MISYNFRNAPKCYKTMQLIGKKDIKDSQVSRKLLKFFMNICHKEILKVIKFHVKVNTQNRTGIHPLISFPA